MPVGHCIGYAERAAFYATEYVTTVDHDFLKSLVTDEVRSILEIPAGVGRNLGWLAGTRRDVVMADLEPEMIRRLSERIAEERGDDRLTALVADIRFLELGRTFDLVLVPQGGLQLLPGAGDVARALDRLQRHLAPQGTLLVDLATFEAAPEEEDAARPAYFDPAIPSGLLVHEWVRPLPFGGMLTRRRTQHLDRNALTTTFFYSVETANGASEEASFVMVSRCYRYEQVAALVGAAGLAIRQVCRNYRRDPYLGTGHRIIFVLAAV